MYSVEIAVVEAAVLIESGWYKDRSIYNEIWVVSSSLDVTIMRIMSRNNLSEADARSRVKSQMHPDERKVYADVVIDNDSSIEALQCNVDKQWTLLQSKVHNITSI